MKGTIAAKLGIGLLVLMMAFVMAPLSHSFAAPSVVRMTLIDENGSGQDGSAQLTDNGDGTTKVELIMLNMPAAIEQPAGIHTGTCTTLDPDVAYALDNIETDGKSTTTIKVDLDVLLGAKYAVAVLKAVGSNVVYSCANVPSAAAASGTLTTDQALQQLVDQAEELLGTIQKKEVDGSANAYNAYHATFASIENTIKAKSADAQAGLEDAMHEVRDALAKSDWAAATTAAKELVDQAKEAQTLMKGSGGTAASGAATSAIASQMQVLGDATKALAREIANKDKDGADRAYNDFHTAFAGIEDQIKAKSAEAQEHIEEAMHEVRDALAAGDWAKAGAAVQELQDEVADATAEMTAAPPNVPKTGVSNMPFLFSLFVCAAMLMLVGGAARRRSSNQAR